MLKRYFTYLISLLMTCWSFPAIARPSQTKIPAQLACMNYSDYPVINPEYAGKTRSGLDIWICIETGTMRRTFLMLNQGPYAVIICNIVECKLAEWTY